MAGGEYYMKLKTILSIALISALISFGGMVGVTQAQANYQNFPFHYNFQHSHDKHHDDHKSYWPTPSVTPVPSEEVAPSVTPEVSDNTSGCTQNCGTPPTFQGSTTQAPVCTEPDTTQSVANPFVKRNGTEAVVNFFITEGNEANIYYKESGTNNWQYAVADLSPNGDNFVSYTINALKQKVAYDFGIQETFGCGGGLIITAPVFGK
jgi:hypothetical protein